MSAQESRKELWNKAIQYLSRREYSRVELANKLAGEPADVEFVLVELEEKGYLSDKRFAESFLRVRIGQGHGLNKIRYELKQKGIAPEVLADAIEMLDVNWFELAAELYKRKYSAHLEVRDFKERNKRMRFLSQRGFSMDEINYAMKQIGEFE